MVGAVTAQGFSQLPIKAGRALRLQATSGFFSMFSPSSFAEDAFKFILRPAGWHRRSEGLYRSNQRLKWQPITQGRPRSEANKYSVRIYLL